MSLNLLCQTIWVQAVELEQVVSVSDFFSMCLAEANNFGRALFACVS